MTPKLRFALVARGHSPREIAAYLPDNYRLEGFSADGTALVAGHDSAGWTLDEYVIPRFASGLIGAREVSYCDVPTIVAGPDGSMLEPMGRQ